MFLDSSNTYDEAVNVVTGYIHFVKSLGDYVPSSFNIPSHEMLSPHNFNQSCKSAQAPIM